MFNIRARIVKRPDIPNIVKQINFGTAKGLTETAKQGQKAAIGAIKGSFTTRGTWFNPSMKHGIRITPATKTKLQAEVKTAADWLEPHETGDDKTGRDHRLGVPQDKIRPRGSTRKIRADQKVRRLLASGKAFILKTKNGDVVAMRQGRGKRKSLVILYGLEKSVRIRKRSTFYEPIQKVVNRRLKKNIEDGIQFALRTAR